MTSGSYDITHKKILESGKKFFLKNGFERTNLRELCRGAGITTGAFYRHFKDKEALFSELVEPAINGLHEKYNVAEDICFDYLLKGNLKDMWNISTKTLEEFIHYIFQHFDSFKLLLQCSDGTKYVNFTDWMVEQEMKSTFKMYDVLEEKGVKFQRIGIKEMHMLTHSYYSCIFETVLHDYEKDEALKCIHILADFFSSGWKKILGL